MLNKTYAVFGLGRYGSAVAKELVESGAEVIAVDIEEKRADEMVEILPICKLFAWWFYCCFGQRWWFPLPSRSRLGIRAFFVWHRLQWFYT